MTSQSAYRLRRHFDAQGFRLAWDAALDYAIRRLSDAVYARAIHGVAVPHYYKGEVVGEHRRYDERLAMFLLRYRDPARYAKGWDKIEPVDGHEELFAVRLARLMLHLESGTPICPFPCRRRANPTTTRTTSTPRRAVTFVTFRRPPTALAFARDHARLAAPRSRRLAMGLLDGLLGQVAGNVDIQNLAAKVGSIRIVTGRLERSDGRPLPEPPARGVRMPLKRQNEVDREYAVPSPADFPTFLNHAPSNKALGEACEILARKLKEARS